MINMLVLGISPYDLLLAQICQKHRGAKANLWLVVVKAVIDYIHSLFDASKRLHLRLAEHRDVYPAIRIAT